ncbi:MAG: D-sedoheptulose-7-phosphate isomerase [Streptosporangiaceae bacterium]
MRPDQLAPPAGSIDLTGNDAVAAFERRIAATRELAERAGAIATAAHAMAIRFHQGGKLIAFGTGPASTDAQHVAVEFVHPVIVGKRALPAICLTCDAATITAVAAEAGLAEIFAHQVDRLAVPADIAIGISADGNCPAELGGLRAAGAHGLLTIALAGGDGGTLAAAGVADHLLPGASGDPRIIKETQVTTYHVLWELVHVFFEQPGVLGPGIAA